MTDELFDCFRNNKLNFIQVFAGDYLTWKTASKMYSIEFSR